MWASMLAWWMSLPGVLSSCDQVCGDTLKATTRAPCCWMASAAAQAADPLLHHELAAAPAALFCSSQAHLIDGVGVVAAT